MVLLLLKWSDKKCFIETVVPLERCVATENDLMALLIYETWMFFYVNSSWALTLCLLKSDRFHLLPIDVSAHILYSHLVMLIFFKDKI